MVGGRDEVVEALGVLSSEPVGNPDGDGGSATGLHHARGLRVARRPHGLDEGAPLPGEELGRHRGEPGERLGEGHRLAFRLL
jgi:hypothetical protein